MVDFYTFCMNGNRNEYSAIYLFNGVMIASRCTSQKLRHKSYVIELLLKVIVSLKIGLKILSKSSK